MYSYTYLQVSFLGIKIVEWKCTAVLKSDAYAIMSRIAHPFLKAKNWVSERTWPSDHVSKET